MCNFILPILSRPCILLFVLVPWTHRYNPYSSRNFNVCFSADMLVADRHNRKGYSKYWNAFVLSFAYLLDAVNATRYCRARGKRSNATLPKMSPLTRYIRSNISMASCLISPSFTLHPSFSPDTLSHLGWYVEVEVYMTQNHAETLSMLGH